MGAASMSLSSLLLDAGFDDKVCWLCSFSDGRPVTGLSLVFMPSEEFDPMFLGGAEELCASSCIGGISPLSGIWVSSFMLSLPSPWTVEVLIVVPPSQWSPKYVV